MYCAEIACSYRQATVPFNKTSFLDNHIPFQHPHHHLHNISTNKNMILEMILYKTIELVGVHIHVIYMHMYIYICIHIYLRFVQKLKSVFANIAV